VTDNVSRSPGYRIHRYMFDSPVKGSP